jgi:hypothetical protein
MYFNKQLPSILLLKFANKYTFISLKNRYQYWCVLGSNCQYAKLLIWIHIWCKNCASS